MELKDIPGLRRKLSCGDANHVETAMPKGVVRADDEEIDAHTAEHPPSIQNCRLTIFHTRTCERVCIKGDGVYVRERYSVASHSDSQYPTLVLHATLQPAFHHLLNDD